MAYEIYRNLTDRDDLVQKIKDFLDGNGWTTSEITSSPKKVHAWKVDATETFYYEFYSNGSSGVAIRGIDATPTPSDTSSEVFINCVSTNIPSVQLFGGDGNYVYIVVESATNYLATGGFGRLISADSFDTSNNEGSFVIGTEDDVWTTVYNVIGNGHNRNFVFDISGVHSMNHVRHKNSSGTSWKKETTAMWYYTASGANDAHLVGDYYAGPIAIPAAASLLESTRQPIINAVSIVDGSPYGYYPNLYVGLIKDIPYNSVRTIGADDYAYFPYPYINRHAVSLLEPRNELGLIIKK